MTTIRFKQEVNIENDKKKTEGLKQAIAEQSLDKLRRVLTEICSDIDMGQAILVVDGEITVFIWKKETGMFAYSNNMQYIEDVGGVNVTFSSDRGYRMDFQTVL